MTWSGGWVAARLGVEVTTTGSTGGHDVASLCGLALRRNPRRAHLLVSQVLGKHLPVDAGHALAVARELGGLVASLVAEPARTLVIGYAETATALGHEVARAVGAPYLHSTRRPATSQTPEALAFEEAHSHATSHRLLPADPGLLSRPETVVLVDDELSTGATVLATIRQLQRVGRHRHYVVAALVDLRGDADRAAADALARDLGVRLDVVALASGRIDLGDDLPARAAVLLMGLSEVSRLAALAPQTPGWSEVSRLAALAPQPPGWSEVSRLAALAPQPPGWSEVSRLAALAPRPPVVRVDAAWPAGVPVGGRHGFAVADEAPFAAAVEGLAAAVRPHLEGERIHVLGTEELMYLPMRLAEALTRTGPGATVSSTTRSPVAVVDDPAYAVRSALTFGDHDDPLDGPGERYAYNLADAGIDTLVLVVDEAGRTERLDELLARLTTVAGRVVLVGVP